MGFNFVEYDGSPDRFIEPVAPGYNADLTNPNVTTVNHSIMEVGAVAGFEFYEGRPYEVHSFGDPAGL
jgi:hypothetical protein